MAAVKGCPIFQEKLGPTGALLGQGVAGWQSARFPGVPVPGAGPGGGPTPGERDGDGAGTRPTAPTCPASAALARLQLPISKLGLEEQSPEAGHPPFHLPLLGAARTLSEGKGTFPPSASGMVIKPRLQCPETCRALCAGSESLPHADCTRYKMFLGSRMTCPARVT